MIFLFQIYTSFLRHKHIYYFLIKKKENILYLFIFVMNRVSSKAQIRLIHTFLNE